jgi:lipoprotein-releasing system permease protein
MIQLLNWPLCFLIALRYAKNKRSSGVINFITLFTVLGITIGIAALILVVSVMDGFEAELKSRILGTVPHVSIHKEDMALEKTKQLAAELNLSSTINQQLELVESNAIVQVPDNLVGLLIQGIRDTDSIPKPLMNSIRIGQWDSLFKQKYGIVIGYQLANKYNIVPGDKVRVLLSGVSHYTPIGRMPAQRNFEVVGIFQTGSDSESQTAFVNSPALNKLLKRQPTANDGIKLMLQDAFLAEQIAKQFQMSLGEDVSVTNWKQTHGSLFSAVKMEKNMMSIMLFLVIVVAAFNMISSLVMMVTQKQSEIAILKTQGLTAKNITMIFVLQGSYNGLLGTLIGVGLGVIMVFGINPVMQATGIQLLGPVGIGIPILLSWQKVIFVAFFALLLALAASIYPALKAAKVEPAEALRHE